MFAGMRAVSDFLCRTVLTNYGSSQLYLHTHALIHELNEPYLSFAIPAEAGRYLPTPEGWKAKLAQLAGHTHRSLRFLLKPL